MAIYAQWNGTNGYNQREDDAGYITMPSGLKISDPGDDSNYNSHGFYVVDVTQPTLDTDETKDQPIWGFDGSTITLTWSVRNKTQDELDQETAGPTLSREGYYILKNLFDAGIITTSHVDNDFSQAMKDAYYARARLEGDL